MNDERTLGPLIKEAFGRYPFSFRASDSDVSFTVRRPDPEIEGNWLITQHTTGCTGWRRSGNQPRQDPSMGKKQPTMISKSQEEIIEIAGANNAHNIMLSMCTIGTTSNGREFLKRRSTKATKDQQDPKKTARLSMLKKIHQQVLARNLEQVPA